MTYFSIQDLPEYSEAPETTRHSEYYFVDDLVVFKVQNTLFRVHRHFFRAQSSSFTSIFALSEVRDTTKGGSFDGSSDIAPIILDGTTVLEFESLLSFFYQGMLESFEMPTANWIALLSIAHRHDFKDAEDRATREIYRTPTLDPLKQICIAEQFKVHTKHFIPAIKALVARSDPLTKSEMEQISHEMAAGISAAREQVQRNSFGLFGKSRAKATDDAVQARWVT